MNITLPGQKTMLYFDIFIEFFLDMFLVYQNDYYFM